MTEALQIIVGAIVVAGTLALTGEGFAILYKTTGVLSIAQGAFMVLGAFLYTTFQPRITWLGAAIAVILVMLILGAASYVIVFRRLVGAPLFVISIATIGVSGVIVAASQLIWGTGVRTLSSPLNKRSITLLHNVAISGVALTVLSLALVVGIGVEVFSRRSRVGFRMRAVAEDPSAAVYLGVNVQLVSMGAWAVSAATAGLAGVLYSFVSQLNPSTLPEVALVAFPAVLLGGLDSVGGALVGALIIGVIEQIVTVFYAEQAADPMAYIAMLILMFFFPTGIFGRSEVSRL